MSETSRTKQYNVTLIDIEDLKPIQWYNNVTRLNQSNMNAISDAVDLCVNELFGVYSYRKKGLYQVVPEHSTYIQGSMPSAQNYKPESDIGKYFGLQHQIKTLGLIIISPLYSNTSTAEWNPITLANVINNSVYSLPKVDSNSNWGDAYTPANKYTLGFSSNASVKTSLLSNDGILNRYAESISWNYHRIMDIGHTYRRNGIYFTNYNSSSVHYPKIECYTIGTKPSNIYTALTIGVPYIDGNSTISDLPYKNVMTIYSGAKHNKDNALIAAAPYVQVSDIRVQNLSSYISEPQSTSLVPLGDNYSFEDIASDDSKLNTLVGERIMRESTDNALQVQINVLQQSQDEFVNSYLILDGGGAFDADPDGDWT